MIAPTCKRKGCGSKKRWHFEKKVWECVECLRNLAGFCRDCDHGRTTTRRGMRCAPCTIAHHRRLDATAHRRLYRTNDEYRQRAVDYSRNRRADPATKPAPRPTKKRPPMSAAERKLENKYKRVWRKNHPLTREQKDANNERRRRKYATDPEWREAYLQANRDRRAEPTELRAQNFKQSVRDHARRSPQANRQPLEWVAV